MKSIKKFRKLKKIKTNKLREFYIPKVNFKATEYYYECIDYVAVEYSEPSITKIISLEESGGNVISVKSVSMLYLCLVCCPKHSKAVERIVNKLWKKLYQMYVGVKEEKPLLEQNCKQRKYAKNHF